MKIIINKIFTKFFGYHLAKSNIDKVEKLFSSKWMKSFNFSTVIDIGANSGQFSQSIRKAMPYIPIIAFEPIDAEYNKLMSKFRKDNNFQAYNIALGNKTGVIDFEINEFSPTSSFLEYTDNQRSYFPITGKTKKSKVKIKKIDDVLKFKNNDVLLKIDVQGFEKEVILGGLELLKHVSVIYIECSFKEFYKDQPLFEDIHNILSQNSFYFRGIGDKLEGNSDEEILQVDAIFIKEKR